MTKSKRKRRRKPRPWVPAPVPPSMSDAMFTTYLCLFLAAIVATIYFSYTEVYRPLVGRPKLDLQVSGIAFYATFQGDQEIEARSGARSLSILTPESRAFAVEKGLTQMPDAAVSELVTMPVKTRFKRDAFAHMDALRRLDPEPDGVRNEWGGTIQVFVGYGGVLIAYDHVPRRLCDSDYDSPPFAFGFQCNGKFQYRH